MEKSSKTKTICKKTMCFRVRGRNENSSCILARSFMTPFTLAAFTNYQWQLLFSSTNNGQIELRTSKPRAVLTSDFFLRLVILASSTRRLQAPLLLRAACAAPASASAAALLAAACAARCGLRCFRVSLGYVEVYICADLNKIIQLTKFIQMHKMRRSNSF